MRRTRGEGSDFLVVLSLHVCLFRVCLGFLPRGVMIEGGLEIFAPNIFYRFKSNLINNYLWELEIGFAKQRKQQDRAVQCYRYQGGMENFAQFFFTCTQKWSNPDFNFWRSKTGFVTSFDVTDTREGENFAHFFHRFKTGVIKITFRNLELG